MNHQMTAYGMWSLVAINSAIFIIFAFSFFHPKTAFFFLIMRYGRGAHMMHGHGSHQERCASGGNRTTVALRSKGPVCGMDVEPGHGYAESYEGKDYSFCSRKCLDDFDADPLRVSWSRTPDLQSCGSLAGASPCRMS